MANSFILTSIGGIPTYQRNGGTTWSKPATASISSDGLRVTISALPDFIADIDPAVDSTTIDSTLYAAGSKTPAQLFALVAAVLPSSVGGGTLTTNEVTTIRQIIQSFTT